MSVRMFAQPALLAALVATGAAFAQSTAAPVTDVGPPPAEERDSSGALVLENSLVRAQREKAFNAAASRTGVGTVGRGAVRARTAAPAQGEIANALESEAAELRRLGAGSLTEK